METKRCNIKAELNEDSRIVKGYFSAFGNVDSDKDVIVKGAFLKSRVKFRGQIPKLESL